MEKLLPGVAFFNYQQVLFYPQVFFVYFQGDRLFNEVVGEEWREYEK